MKMNGLHINSPKVQKEPGHNQSTRFRPKKSYRKEKDLRTCKSPKCEYKNIGVIQDERFYKMGKDLIAGSGPFIHPTKL